MIENSDWILYLLVWGPLCFTFITMVVVFYRTRIFNKTAVKQSLENDNNFKQIYHEHDEIISYLETILSAQRTSGERIDLSKLTWHDVLVAILHKTNEMPSEQDAYTFNNDDKRIVQLLALINAIATTTEPNNLPFELVEVVDCETDVPEEQRSRSFEQQNESLTEDIFIDVGNMSYTLAVSRNTATNIKHLMQQQMLFTNRKSTKD